MEDPHRRRTRTRPGLRLNPFAGPGRAGSSATYYAWKAKFGGLEVSDAKRLRSLEEENAR